MMIKTFDLPYALDALEPHVSRACLENHYNNHYRRYVERTKELAAKSPLANAGLEQIVRETARKKTTSQLFSNAAQAWNHEFYWRSMKPGGGGQPTGPIARHIETDFNGYDNFVAKFKKAASSLFASGWAWLVLDGNKLKIATTKDEQTPLARGLTPLLAVDLWEHAYYPDYMSKRDEFVDAFLGSLLNWDFVNENLAKANVLPMPRAQSVQPPAQPLSAAPPAVRSNGAMTAIN